MPTTNKIFIVLDRDGTLLKNTKSLINQGPEETRLLNHQAFVPLLKHKYNQGTPIVIASSGSNLYRAEDLSVKILAKENIDVGYVKQHKITNKIQDYYKDQKIENYLDWDAIGFCKGYDFVKKITRDIYLEKNLKAFEVKLDAEIDAQTWIQAHEGYVLRYKSVLDGTEQFAYEDGYLIADEKLYRIENGQPTELKMRAKRDGSHTIQDLLAALNNPEGKKTLTQTMDDTIRQYADVGDESKTMQAIMRKISAELELEKKREIAEKRAELKKSYQDPSSEIIFYAGKTKITINMETFSKYLQELNEDGKYKGHIIKEYKEKIKDKEGNLIEETVYRPLDWSKLTNFLTHLDELNLTVAWDEEKLAQLGWKIEAPATYERLHPENVIFNDDSELYRIPFTLLGFTAIQADTIDCFDFAETNPMHDPKPAELNTYVEKNYRLLLKDEIFENTVLYKNSFMNFFQSIPAKYKSLVLDILMENPDNFIQLFLGLPSPFQKEVIQQLQQRTGIQAVDKEILLTLVWMAESEVPSLSLKGKEWFADKKHEIYVNPEVNNKPIDLEKYRKNIALQQALRKSGFDTQLYACITDVIHKDSRAKNKKSREIAKAAFSRLREIMRRPETPIIINNLERHLSTLCKTKKRKIHPKHQLDLHTQSVLLSPYQKTKDNPMIALREEMTLNPNLQLLVLDLENIVVWNDDREEFTFVNSSVEKHLNAITSNPDVRVVVLSSNKISQEENQQIQDRIRVLNNSAHIVCVNEKDTWDYFMERQPGSKKDPFNKTMLVNKIQDHLLGRINALCTTNMDSAYQFSTLAENSIVPIFELRDQDGAKLITDYFAILEVLMQLPESNELRQRIVEDLKKAVMDLGANYSPNIINHDNGPEVTYIDSIKQLNEECNKYLDSHQKENVDENDISEKEALRRFAELMAELEQNPDLKLVVVDFDDTICHQRSPGTVHPLNGPHLINIQRDPNVRILVLSSGTSAELAEDRMAAEIKKGKYPQGLIHISTSQAISKYFNLQIDPNSSPKAHVINAIESRLQTNNSLPRILAYFDNDEKAITECAYPENSEEELPQNKGIVMLVPHDREKSTVMRNIDYFAILEFLVRYQHEPKVVAEIKKQVSEAFHKLHVALRAESIAEMRTKDLYENMNNIKSAISKINVQISIVKKQITSARDEQPCDEEQIKKLEQELQTKESAAEKELPGLGEELLRLQTSIKEEEEKINGTKETALQAWKDYANDINQLSQRCLVELIVEKDNSLVTRLSEHVDEIEDLLENQPKKKKFSARNDSRAEVFLENAKKLTNELGTIFTEQLEQTVMHVAPREQQETNQRIKPPKSWLEIKTTITELHDAVKNMSEVKSTPIAMFDKNEALKIQKTDKIDSICRSLHVLERKLTPFCSYEAATRPSQRHG